MASSKRVTIYCLKVKDSIALNDNNRSIRAGHDMTLSTEGTLSSSLLDGSHRQPDAQRDGKVINSKSVVTGVIYDYR
jgi:filamentous hemagglutinin